MEAHLGRGVSQRARLEVTSAHPVLDGAEDVFHGSSSDAHGIGHMIEPCLHRIEHMLMLPAPDSSVRFGRAARLELASLARRQVTVEGAMTRKYAARTPDVNDRRTRGRVMQRATMRVCVAA